jgi:hypothetical protein
MTSDITTKLALAALVAAAACGGSGMGQNVRNDITQQMSTTQPKIAACYETALQEKRKLRGTMWLNFAIEPKTGRFSRVAVTRSELQHQGLEACVRDAVSGLALAVPQKSTVSVDYPIQFEPELVPAAAPAP